ncbi:hypothetical protein, partial [Microcoleus sp. N9_A1]|uniref:hypothetical protein n=1 Tax=Microcoleus sp. N9_A1 TaxID=3055380 RepID=UPI002FD644D4
ELRVKVQEILASLTNHVIGFLTGWSLDFTFFISSTSLKKWYQSIQNTHQQKLQGDRTQFRRPLGFLTCYPQVVLLVEVGLFVLF